MMLFVWIPRSSRRMAYSGRNISARISLMLLNPKKSLGISLLELMLSLLIIVAIIFTVTRYFQVANQNLKVSQAEDMINNVVDASYKWLEGRYTFATPNPISITALVNAGLLPNNIYQNPERANPWKGAITVAPASDPNKINIIMNDVPLEGCYSLVAKIKKYAPNAQCTGGAGNRIIFVGTF